MHSYISSAELRPPFITLLISTYVISFYKPNDDPYACHKPNFIPLQQPNALGKHSLETSGTLRPARMQFSQARHKAFSAQSRTLMLALMLALVLELLQFLVAVTLLLVQTFSPSSAPLFCCCRRFSLLIRSAIKILLR